MTRHYAHSHPDKAHEGWHLLEKHLKKTGDIACKFAAKLGYGEWAYVAGLWHDIGKYSDAFQNRLEGSAKRVDHATAGAKVAIENLDNQLGPLMAYAIAGHHTGLPDGLSDSDSCLRTRLKQTITDYSACPKNILCYKHNINSSPLVAFDKKNNERCAFQLHFFIRFLFSCLVDADYLDTEAFMDVQRSFDRGGYPSISEMKIKLNKKLAEFEPDSEINKYRRKILDWCLDAADKPSGLFSLTVPTGGGKTLSSLAFALKHAERHAMNRVIYVIPYTSIIEQNAGIFRNIFGNEALLEHHSNFEPDEDDSKSKFSAENWDAPLIVTTNVQFFESLFHNRSSRCRKLHNIANSVIILDEAQMLPVKLLKPCMEALRELVKNYNSTVVLCTATQPALAKTEEFSAGLEDVSEIVHDPIGLHDKFMRVQVSFLSEDHEKTLDAELSKKLLEHEQVLCVVNTRKHAKKLNDLVKDKNGLYHLSALMCPAHRSEVIKQIKESLNMNKKCRVISTQLIEAGVDIDFPVVFRSLAGIDSIAQAAGRCNREGKLKGKGKVYVFYPEDGLPIGYLRQCADTAKGIMRRHSDLLSNRAVSEYFKNLYWKNEDKLDEKGILSRLSRGVRKLNFPFKKIATDFKIIENNMEPIIIPYNDEAQSIIEKLRYAEFPRSLARKAQRYSVQVYPQVLAKLTSAGAIDVINECYNVLINEDLYKENVGLDSDEPTFRDIENNIC